MKTARNSIRGRATPSQLQRMQEELIQFMKRQRNGRVGESDVIADYLGEVFAHTDYTHRSKSKHLEFNEEWLKSLNKSEAHQVIRVLCKQYDSLSAVVLRLMVAASREESLSKTQQGKRGARAALARSPKQLAKKEAFELWKERHAGKHPKLRTNEQFAAECMRSWPVLTSAKVILGWCTEWKRSSKQFPAS